MAKIHLLNPLVANQIAAGEVIERPASIVKELLENSIDAGAKQINIDIERGGNQLIRIQDNGCGITKEDLPLAVARFGTSKIHTLSDLNAIYSLGFRGEALASITAVAKVKICSLAENHANAWELIAEGTQCEILSKPAAHPQGTTIEVRDLFFNTPARRKFLRTEKTEFSHIETVMQRMSLANFPIRFSLSHNGKNHWQLLSAITLEQQEKRIQQICGKEFLQHCYRIDIEATDLTLTGWVAEAAFSKAQQDLQFMYINGRMVKDKLINHAIRQAYQNLLDYKRFPAYVLFLQCDPAQVDINVHPTKHEVRFREGRLIHDFVYQSLHKVLNSDQSQVPAENSATQTIYSIEHSAENFFHRTSPPQIQEQLEHYGQLAQVATANAVTNKIENVFIEQPTIIFNKLLAPLQQHYILVETNKGLGFFDIKATYEYLYLQALQKKPIVLQPLLFPLRLLLNQYQSQQFETNQHLLKKLGFELSPIDKQQLLLRAAPKIFVDVDFNLFLLELLQEKNISAVTIAACAATYCQPNLTTAAMEKLLQHIMHLPMTVQQKLFKELSLLAIKNL